MGVEHDPLVRNGLRRRAGRILWLLDDSEDWRRIALVLLHRYVYVVEVLMVGCGWSVKRPKGCSGLLGGRKAVEARLAEAGARTRPSPRS